MYLSDPIVSLHYDSGNEYVLSIESSTDKIRLFEEDEDKTGEYNFQCFTTFDAVTEGGKEYLSIEELVERADNILVASRMEGENTLKTTTKHPSSDYPPV
jgi:hypothetical protein